MKNSTIKALLAATILLSTISVLSMLPNAYASTTAKGGDCTGNYSAKETWYFHQNKYADYATDLHFKLWEEYDNCWIKGWEVTFTQFTASSGQRGDQPEPAHSTLTNYNGLTPTNDPDNGMHAVDFEASGAHIDYCTSIMITIKIWGVGVYNYMLKSGVSWTKGLAVTEAIPDYGWEVAPPVRAEGAWNHSFVMKNYDATDDLAVTNMTFFASETLYEDLTTINFTGPAYDFTLNSSQTWSTNVTTPDPYYHPAKFDGHIYFKYNIVNSTGDMLAEVWGDHPVIAPGNPFSVGGFNVPVNKFGVMAPYIGFASIVLGTVLATAIYVKRAKRKK